MANEKFLDLNGLTRYDRKIKSFVEGNSIVKCDTMPIASDRNFGQIIQYVGTTDATYTNGYFYKSIIDGDDNHVWQRVDIQPSIDPNDYYTKAQTNTMLGKLTMRGYSGVDAFNTNTNEPGVYFIRASGFSDGHGHTSFPSNYGLHPGTFFGVLYFLKKYDDAEAGEDLGYIYGISTDANNNGWVAKFRKVSGGNYIAYSGFESNNIIHFLTTTTNQTGISGKKTFTTLPESSVVPTTDNQLVNKKYVDDSIASIPVSPSIQYSEIPEAGAGTVGTIIQYIGPDDYNLHGLTLEEAIEGFSGVYIPQVITLEEEPVLNEAVSFSNGTLSLEVAMMDNSGIVGPEIHIVDTTTGYSKSFYYDKTGSLTYELVSTSDLSGYYKLPNVVVLDSAWEDFAEQTLQLMSEEPVYKNGCFYIGADHQFTPLTRDKALAGVLKCTLPESFILTDFPEDETEVKIEIDNHSEYVSVKFFDFSGGVSTIRVTTQNGTYSYVCTNGSYYKLSSPNAPVITFSEEAFLITEWSDFAGLVLLQDSPVRYTWDQKDVQPMSNYYTKAEIDAMLGDINTILSTLTIPTQVEQELSEI